MKFMFVGNPGRRDDSNIVTVFGKTFPMRVPVEVTDAHAIAKLKNNGHFVLVDELVHEADVAVDPETAPAVVVDEPAVYADAAPRKARKAK